MLTAEFSDSLWTGVTAINLFSPVVNLTPSMQDLYGNR